MVRTDPHVIAGAIPEEQMPFSLICDAEGVLYEHFCVPSTTSWFRSHSLTALRILKEARKMGYKAVEGETYQLPLTLLIDRDGTVLMAHYGQSLTDLPENCAAGKGGQGCAGRPAPGDGEAEQTCCPPGRGGDRRTGSGGAGPGRGRARNRCPAKGTAGTGGGDTRRAGSCGGRPPPESDRHKELSQAAALLFGDGKDE